MKLRSLFILTAMIGMLISVAYLLIPRSFLGLYGVEPTSFGLYAARFFGGSTFSFSILIWLARDVHDERALRAIVTGLLVSFLIATILVLIGQLSAVLNALGWINCAVFALLLLGYAYFAFGPSERLLRG